MASKKITDLSPIATLDVNVSTDPLPIVDVSDTSMAASGTTKKITVSQIASTIYSSNPSIFTGTTVDPNGSVTAVPGSIYFDLTTPSAPVQWVKTTGSGSTGWI